MAQFKNGEILLSEDDKEALGIKKLQVKCQCNQVTHNRNPMFSEMQTVRDMSHTWKGDKDKEWEAYQANKD